MEIQAPGEQVHSIRLGDLTNFRYYMQLLFRNCVYFLFPFRSFQPGSPPSRPYEAPTPGAGWASTPGGNYSEAGTPRDSSAYGSTTSYPFKTIIYTFLFLC